MKDNLLAERLQLLRTRYAQFAPPLLLLLTVGLVAAPALAWTAAVLLTGLTLNRLAKGR